MSISRSLIVIAGVAVLGGIAVGVWQLREPTPVQPPASPIYAAFAMAEGLTLGAGADQPFGIALAADGRHAIYPAAKQGVPQLWLHDLATNEIVPLTATDGAVQPFVAPDGKTIGFFAGGRLRTMRTDTREIADLAEAQTPRGGAFLPNGDVIFAATATSGLVRHRAIDRVVDTLTSVDTAAGETSHRFPVVVGDGSHVLFFVRAAAPTRQGLWIARVDQPAQRTRLIGSDGSAVFNDGWIVHARDGSLFAQSLTGLAGTEPPTVGPQAVLLGAPAGHSPHDQVLAAAAADVVIFGPARSSLRELRWVNRQGVPTGTVGALVDAWDLRIAPDGGRIAVTQADPQLATLDIWAYDGDRPLPRRISPGIDADELMAWSPDGTRLAWVSGRRSVVVRGAMAELREDTLRKFEGPVRVSDWTADMRTIVITQSHPGTREDIWLLPAADGAEPRVYAARPFNELQGVVSPDGQWMAYASDESGQFEIYVDSFPTPGRRGKLTSGGGMEPRWSGNGSEVFFRRGPEIHAVAVDLSATQPEGIASVKLFETGGDIRAYDVTRDGQRFLVNVPAPEEAPRSISMVINWKSLLPVKNQ
jgi:Tol biopolymer transport system component